jgi:hypothetical protein
MYEERKIWECRRVWDGGHSQAEAARLFCDLTKGHAFFPERNGPAVPILTAFGADRLHQCKLQGS